MSKVSLTIYATLAMYLFGAVLSGSWDMDLWDNLLATMLFIVWLLTLAAIEKDNNETEE